MESSGTGHHGPGPNHSRWAVQKSTHGRGDALDTSRPGRLTVRWKLPARRERNQGSIKKGAHCCGSQPVRVVTAPHRRVRSGGAGSKWPWLGTGFGEGSRQVVASVDRPHCRATAPPPRLVVGRPRSVRGVGGSSDHLLLRDERPSLEPVIRLLCRATQRLGGDGRSPQNVSWPCLRT
jgi:hypothetical protein